jgi:protein-L-isoaspartate O-methyltransferase
LKNDPRFPWALEVLDVKPKDHILEIGCGVGLAVEQIAPLLKTGTITAIDRSKAAIDKAVRRNAPGIEKGTVTFRQTDLLRFTDEPHSYNKIFSFNVNLFWTQKSIYKEAAILKEHLSKKGSVYVFYGPLFEGWFEKIKAPVYRNLEQENFTISQAVHDRKIRCCCFIANP